MKEKVVNRVKYHFLTLLCVNFFTFSATGYAQTADIRTLAEINAVKNKTVIDYFLLCPDIYFSEPADAPSHIIVPNVKRDKITVSEKDRANALRFRKSLIKRESLSEEIEYKECIVDTRNGYIKVSGRHQARTFEISFTIFERSGKLPIPALTFHEGASDEDQDHWTFYDITDGKWKPLDETNFIPPFSLNNFKPFASNKSIASIPGYRIIWKLILPRYGTTIKIVPDINYMEMSPDESDQLYALCQPFENYVLECTWSKEGKFGAPSLAFFDRTILPKNSDTISASTASLLLPSIAFNLLTGSMPYHVRKSLVGKKKTETESMVYNIVRADKKYLEIKSLTKSVTPSDEQLIISFAGQEKTSDLFSVSQRNGDEPHLSVWAIDRNTGVATKRKETN